jgi:hypothetical protein
MAKKTKPEVKPVTKPEVAEKFAYHMIVETNGTEFSTETNDLFQAILDMPIPPLFKTETIFRITKEDKTIEKILQVYEARRVFQNRTSCQLLAINLTKMLP